jgi:hypothetical protein
METDSISHTTLIPISRSVFDPYNLILYLMYLGLDRTGHMSFLTGQDRTPKYAGQVLPDRTESGLFF